MLHVMHFMMFVLYLYMCVHACKDSVAWAAPPAWAACEASHGQRRREDAASRAEYDPDR